MNLKIINAALGLVVVVVVLAFASLLVFSDQFTGLDGWRRVFLICVMVLYGFFRAYRVYKLFKESNENK